MRGMNAHIINRGTAGRLSANRVEIGLATAVWMGLVFAVVHFGGFAGF